MRPKRTSSLAATQVGWWRYMKASMSTTPARWQASTMRSASADVVASGFSQRTCLPASAARMVQSAWRWFGSGM
jgi:hypothetical protein